MISQDFAIALIEIIKKYPWAVDAFPEFQDEVTELCLIDTITLFIKQHKPELNENKAMNFIEKTLIKLSDEVECGEFLKHCEACNVLMNAALFTGLHLKIASTNFDLAKKHDPIFEPHMLQTDNMHMLEAPILRLLNLFIPIKDEPVQGPPTLKSANSTLLCESAHQNNGMRILKQLEQGENPNVLNSQGLAPLHIAACKGHLNALQALVRSKQTNILLKDSNGKTALDHLKVHQSKLHTDDYLIVVTFLSPKMTSIPVTFQKNALYSSHLQPSNIDPSRPNLSNNL